MTNRFDVIKNKTTAKTSSDVKTGTPKADAVAAPDAPAGQTKAPDATQAPTAGSRGAMRDVAPEPKPIETPRIKYSEAPAPVASQAGLDAFFGGLAGSKDTGDAGALAPGVKQANTAKETLGQVVQGAKRTKGKSVKGAGAVVAEGSPTAGAADNAAIDAMFGGATQAPKTKKAKVAPVAPAAEAEPAPAAAPVERLPRLEEEFPEIDAAGWKSDSFVRLEDIPGLPINEQVAWAIRWIHSHALRAEKYEKRYYNEKKGKPGFGERGGLLQEVSAILAEEQSAGLLLIRGALQLQSRDEATLRRDVYNGIKDIARGLYLVQQNAGVARAVQAFDALIETQQVQGHLDEMRATFGTKEIRKFLSPTLRALAGEPESDVIQGQMTDDGRIVDENGELLGAIEEPSEFDPQAEIDERDAEAYATSQLNLDREAELADMARTLAIAPSEAEITAQAQFDADAEYTAATAQSTNETPPDANAGKGGDGSGGGAGPKGPTGPVDDSGAGKERKKKSSDKPLSAAYERIEQAKRWIKGNLNRGKFPLSGDRTKKKVGLVHSDEVNAEISRTLSYFGIPAGKEAERNLFRAFQIYRGFSVDRDGNVFNAKAETVKLSDEQFIKCLKEFRNNTRTYGHPFAYTNPHVKLGGTECFPVITTRQVAKFFTQASRRDGIEMSLSEQEFIDASIDQWDTNVEPRLRRMAPAAQREAIYDFYDAVAEGLGSTRANGRSPEARVSMKELYDADSLFAQMFQDHNPEALSSTMRDRLEREMRARKRNEKKRRAKGRSKDQPLSPDEAVSDPEDLYERMTDPDVDGVLGIVANIGRTMGVLGMPMIAATGVVEKATGVVQQSLATKLLRSVMGGTNTPTERSKELMASPEFVKAIGEMIHIVSWKGMDGLIDAATHGVKFDKAGQSARGSSSFGQKTQGAVDLAMAWSTGDLFFHAKTAQILLDNYIYQLERTAKLKGDNAVIITPQQVEAAMETNPNGFFEMLARTPEGRAAILHAANTSMGGIDPLTETLRKATANKMTDVALGFTVGWYLKFGIRSALRIVPFSNTAVYLTKKGLNKGGLTAGLQKEGNVADSNEAMVGGNETLGQGFVQNFLVDLVRFGTQFGTYTLVYAIIAMLGIEPPDDEEKEHLWYEYKVGGQIIKENWYWQEILGFAMPFAVAVHACNGDIGKAKMIIENGIWEKLEESPWTNALDVVDFVNNFDQKFVEAQGISEGFKGEAPVSKTDFIFTQLMSTMSRRGYQTFEPAIIRALYNERGLGGGTADLAHSPNTVFTSDPNDEDATEMTSWQDAQKRRTAMNSPMAGFLMNLVSGYYTGNPEVQETGYLRKEMPLVANVDPTNQMWINELSVKDENGKFVPADQWTEEQISERVTTVLDLLDKQSASQLAANGVVIPYDARAYAVIELNRQWGAIRQEYEQRLVDNEFNHKALGISFEQARGLQNIAWNETQARQAEVQERISKLFSDEIPYSALKMNRWETSYRTKYTWAEGTDKAGLPATPLDYRINKDKIDVEWYPSGDHKSGFPPFLTVDDKGANTYDAQTPVGWQTDKTDMDFVRQSTEGKVVEQGMFEGRDNWDILSGSGKVGPGSEKGTWDPMKLLFGVRGYQGQRMPFEKLEPKDFPKPEVEKPKASTGGGGWSGGWGGGGGGGGGYAPRIYSNPAYGVRAGNAMQLRVKNPSYTRFDYLRPSVKTKGSREAYRREDF